MRYFLSCVLLVLTACGGSPEVRAPAPGPSVAPSAQVPARPRNTLYRAELERASKAGAARFLAHVDVEPVVEQDEDGQRHFRGFRLLGMRPAEDFLPFDLAPGDIVVRINGQSVEHYETVFALFESLPSVTELKVELLKDGEPKTLVIKVVESPQSMPNKAAAQPQPKPTNSPLPSASSVPSP